MNTEDQLCVVATRGTSRISGVISWVTAPSSYIIHGKLKEVPTHVLLKFPDSFNGDERCFESRIEDGFKGPRSWKVMINKLNSTPGRRMWEIPLSLEDRDVEDVWMKCTAHVGTRPYAKSQLALLYLWRRLGLWFTETPGKWICSEAIGRMLNPKIDLTEAADVENEDQLTPWNATKALVERLGYPMIEVEREEADIGGA